ncbi:G-box binding factor [Balamuthia mandrillaris]
MRKGGEKTHGGGALVGGGSSGGHKRNNSQLCSSSPTLSSASSSSPRLSHQGPSSLHATLSLSSPVTSTSTAAAAAATTSTATTSTPIAPTAPSPLASSSSSASNNTSSASSTTSSTTPPSTPPPSPNHSNQSKRRSTSPGLRREKRHSRRPSSVTLAALTQQLSHQQQQQQQGEFNNTPSAGSGGGGPEQQPVFLDYYLAEYPHVFVAFLLLLSILVLYLPRVALICILLCALFIVLYNNSRQVRRKMQRNRRPVRHSRNNSRVVSPSLESATTKTSSRASSSSRSSSSPPSPLSSSRTTKRVTSKSNSRGKSNNVSGTSSPSLSAGPSPALFSFQSGASSQLGGDDAEDEPQFTYSYKNRKQHGVPEDEEEEEEDQLESRDAMAIVMDEEEEEEGPEQGLKPDVLASHLVGTKRDRRRTKEGKKEKKTKKERTSARPSTTTQNPNFDQEAAEDRGHFSDDELQTKRPRTQKRSGDRSSQLVMLHDFMESQRLSLDLISTALRDSSTDEENSPLKDLHLSSRPRSSSLSPRARERLHHPNSYQESAAPLPVTISGGSAPKTILSELQQQRIGGSFPARSHSTPGTVRIHPTPSSTTTTTSALSPSFYSSPAATSSVPAISSPLASSSSPNSSPVTSPTTSSASLSDTYGYCQGFLPFLLRRGYPLLLNTLNQFSPKCELDCSKRTQAKVMATGNYFKQYYSQLFDYLIARQQRQKATEKYIRKARLTVEEESYYRAEKAMKESMYLRLRRTRLKVQDFQVLSLLGRGGYGEVYLVRNRHTGEILALKRMKKAQFINKNEVPRVKREKEVMVKTQNIWMVKLKLSFQDSTYLYLGMEYCPGGDLRGLLNNLGRLSEDHARLYVAEMVLAVESLHQLGYIHRDLKPGNFLLDKKGHLKLIDFGLSKEGVMKNVRQSRRSSLRFESRRRSSRSRKSLTGDREWAYSLVGSPEYMAPEILEEKGYDETADWWSVGILMFEMVFGYTPFIAETVEEIFANISNWKQVLQFPDLSVVDETPISEAGIDFMKRMICEPDVRLGKNGAENIKSHRFFQGLSWKTIRDIVPPFVPRLTSEFDTTYFGEVEKFDGTKDIAELLEIELGTQNREEEEAEYEAENLEDQPHDAASSSSTNSPSTRHQETTLSDPSSTEEKNSNKNGGKTRRGSGNSTPQQGSPMVSPRGSPKQSSRSNGSSLNGEDTDSSTKGRPSSPSSHLEEQQTEEESASIKPLKDKRVDKVTKEFTPEMKRRRSTHFLNEDEQMFAGFTFTSFNEPPSDPSALFPNPLSFPRSGLAGARKVRKSLLKKTPMHHHAKAKEKKKEKEKEKEKEREKERTSMVVLPTTTEENEEEEEM